MAKAKAKYDIWFKKDTNGANSGEVVIQLADGKYYCLSYSCSPETKIRTAKAEINDHFEKRIPEFLNEYPNARPVSWEDYFAKTSI